MKQKTILFAVFLGAVVAGLVIPAFFLTKTVTVAKPHIGSAVEAIYATGTVEPTIMVPLAPRSAARMTELLAQEGQSVKKGDILARLEDNEQQADIANLTAQLAFAESDFQRKETLYKTRSTSQNIVDAAKAQRDSLAAQLDKIKAQAGYFSLVAPADGVIIRKDGEVGELIPAGQPVFYMSCCAPLRITAEVDEEDIPLVKVGQEVLIQSDAFPDQVFHGNVASITPKGDPVARSYRVRMTYDAAAAPLMIGMTTETNILVKKADQAMLLPASAVGSGNRVQIAANGIVRTVSVQTGIKNVEQIEITSGLQSTDDVIIPFHPDIKDGQKVRIQDYKAPDNKAPISEKVAK